MQVKELMTKDVRTCLATDSINEAARIMWESDCGCVPVVEEDRKLVGIITDRDICMAAYTQGRTLTQMSVDGVASKNVVTVHENDSLHRAEQLMHDAQIRRLPVVDSKDQLVGMLSISDLARRVRELSDGIPGHIVGALAGISQRRPSNSGTKANKLGNEISSTATDLKRELKNSLALLQSLRDEVRVRLHLGSLDLRDQWKKFEPYLGEVEKKAEELTEASRAAVTDAVQRVESFRSSLLEHR
jgi:CBS domain-containing protein